MYMVNQKVENLKKHLDVLVKYNWIYDFQVTELFSSRLFDNKFPHSWKTYFQQTSIEQFKLLIDLDESSLGSASCPDSLKLLLVELKRIASTRDYSEYHAIDSLVIDKNVSRGMTAKKQYEIATMVPFVRALCEKSSCKCLVDIGSGLGYFGQSLAHESDIHVLNIECSSERTQLANKRLVNDERASKQLNNLTFTIQDQHENKFIEYLNAHSANENKGLISLHSCGDLTPSMLKIFRNEISLKFLVAFSCCYHRMVTSSTDSKFDNFPMSKTVDEMLTERSGFNLSVFAMRLACQETISSWKVKTAKEHDAHMKQVGYRAILEAFCNQNNLKLIKLKRKLTSSNDLVDFETYISLIEDRIEFEGHTDFNPNSFKFNIMPLYDQYKDLFSLIEPLSSRFLKILQALMQPVLEYFLLGDRILFLIENGIDATLVKLFDDKISPRCVCILANK